MYLYFASYFTTPEIQQLPYDFGLLMSYIEVKNHALNNRGRKLLLDSGAFSIASGQSNHGIREYIEYVHQHKKQIHVYANLDVIGNAQGTQENQLIMESAGLNPLPTFHYGSDFKYLKQMIKQYEYIGLGGLVSLAFGKRRELFNHLDQCFAIIKGNCKTHGWGMTSAPVMDRYPFYSVDSTRWTVGGRFLQTLKNEGLSLKVSKKNDLTKHYHFKELNLKNAIEIIRLTEQMTQLWKSRGVVWE